MGEVETEPAPMSQSRLAFGAPFDTHVARGVIEISSEKVTQQAMGGDVAAAVHGKDEAVRPRPLLGRNHPLQLPYRP